MLRRNNRSQGQDLVEYALLLPLLLLLLFSIVEGGRLIFTYNTLANAAREGARRGVVYGADETSMCIAALRLTSGLDLSCPGDIVPSLTSSTSQVIITFPFQLIVGPVIQAVGGNPTLNLSASSTMRRE